MLRMNLIGLACVLWLGAMVSDTAADEPASPPEGRTVLLWISLDGFMASYLDRVDTPAFDRFFEQGAYTRALVPAFPSITFSSHVSQATGVTVSEHGIPANSFFDTATGDTWRFPPFARLMQAEPIWHTAQRQGVRTAVLDWPLSHAQAGDVVTEYYGHRFDGSLSDEQRLEQLLHVWRNDAIDPPLQLLMGYAVTVDSPGHTLGPDAPELNEHIEAADKLIDEFMTQVMDIWHQKMSPNDTLYVFITSDHGMSKVDYAVHPSKLAGITERNDIRVLTSGNMAHLYLDQIEPESAREAATQAVFEAVRPYGFAQAYRRAELPQAWGYDHPTRTGDIIVVLDPGYTYSGRAKDIVVPIDDIGGPLGMHGYDPRVDPNMNALAVFWRYPEPLGGIDLGEVHSLQLHPTAAKLLGIQPATGAVAEPFVFEAVVAP